ncbi:MAG TPA: tRNA lysidine(34) synthetase TilS [Candidatus Binatia bacterium]|nr:tRNA lysidine(34) synthetase TilS [Candidatus Binatia bacterium]
MKLELEPGSFVLAVSGGVDSVVLLDLLAGSPGLTLVIAHYDHGIRPDSSKDRQFVENLSKKYDLPFYYEAGKLGPKTSEALARQKRYKFLSSVKERTGSSAIITAHHQDDLVETVLINLLRGTGRRGLSSLKSTPDIRRPLLSFTKADILAYAKAHQLTWREDSTNQTDEYLRNYLRHHIVPKLTNASRAQLLTILDQARGNNAEIDHILAQLIDSHSKGRELDRAWFISLPHDLACEVLLTWLKALGVCYLDRAKLERTVVLLKTLSHGKLIDVDAEHQLNIGSQTLALKTRER